MTIDAHERPLTGHVVLTHDCRALSASAVETFEVDQEGYRRTARLTGEEDFGPTLFPGPTIQLASLWS